MFKIDHIIRKIDDPRIKALNSGRIDEADLMKLVKPEDPFYFGQGELKYLSEAEEKANLTRFIQDTKNIIKQTGRIDANYIYEKIEFFGKAFPEIMDMYPAIKEAIEKEQCVSCAMRSHTIKLLTKIFEVNKDPRDLTSLDPIKEEFTKKFPFGYKKLALETLDPQDTDIEIPTFFKKTRLPILDAEPVETEAIKAVEIPVSTIKTTDRKEVVELLLAISNAAHSEYHLIESMSYNTDKNLIPLIAVSTDLRKTRVSLMEKLAVENKNVASLWCLFKHILLLQFHLYELYQKNHDAYYLEQSKKITLMIDDLLSMEGIEDFRDCPRCEKDKNNE